MQQNCRTTIWTNPLLKEHTRGHCCTLFFHLEDTKWRDAVCKRDVSWEMRTAWIWVAQENTKTQGWNYSIAAWFSSPGRKKTEQLGRLWLKCGYGWGGIYHGKADIRFFQSRSIIGTISCYSYDLPLIHQCAVNYTWETASLQDKLQQQQ